MSNRKKIRRSAWVDKLADAALQVPQGSVGWLRVEHDEWCDKLEDRQRECTCDPNVCFVPFDPKARLN